MVPRYKKVVVDKIIFNKLIINLNEREINNSEV